MLLDGDRLHHVPAFAVDAVDTTGAGDVFRAAFIYALLQSHSPTEILRFAAAAAAISCTREGALTSVPALEEIHHLIFYPQRVEAGLPETVLLLERRPRRFQLEELVLVPAQEERIGRLLQRHRGRGSCAVVVSRPDGRIIGHLGHQTLEALPFDARVVVDAVPPTLPTNSRSPVMSSRCVSS